MIFFEDFNALDTDIKFTMSHSDQSIQFLDTTVYKKDNILYTDLFVKPTDRNNLLKYDSHHPHSTIKSLPYSQLLRVKRIVQDPNLVSKRLDEIYI